jgi:hypothetical protein
VRAHRTIRRASSTSRCLRLSTETQSRERGKYRIVGVEAGLEACLSNLDGALDEVVVHVEARIDEGLCNKMFPGRGFQANRIFPQRVARAASVRDWREVLRTCSRE